MRHKYCVIMILSFLVPARSIAQTFDSHPVLFNPSNAIAFKMNLPITHLDINNYVPSTRGVYAGRTATFKFYNRDYPWTALNLFMRIRWDSDLDASNGVTWSDWFQDQTEDAFATVAKTFSQSGIYTITFEIELYTSDGAQSYKRQKQYEIRVVPMPTAVYKDSQGNQLHYWAGNDGVLDKPILLVEGFDPDNRDTPAINYGLGYNLIEAARSQGYDVYIMEWADGGADMTANRYVLLGACQFVHRQLGSTEAAVQVVGVSMGGVVARDGLAFAEDNLFAHPGQYIEHYVNTFVSFDAPQQGAHINSKLQSLFKDNGTAQQQVTLQSPAAKQLLYEDVYDETYSIHSDFYRSLRSLHNDEQPIGYTNGYPRRCVNFTVSNGNRSTDYPGLTTSDELASVYEYSHVNILSIITLPAISHTVHILAQSRDLWPGSTFPHDLRTLATSGFKDFLSFGPGGVFLLAGGGWIFNVNFNPAYTPTESALDLESFARTTDGSLTGGKSWFDDTLTQLAVRRHEELSQESMSKVLGWLNNNRRYAYLGRPSNLRAMFTADKSVQVTFDDEAAFEAGFKVERKVEGGSYAEIALLNANQTQVVDSDPSLQLFKTYYYRIRSFAGARYSPYSEEIAVNLQPHLQSSSPLATSSNGQHKIIQTTSSSGATDLYMVYESGGNSFLTHYFPPTATWDNEQSIGGTTASGILIRHPSLLLDSLGAIPYVAYERVDQISSSHKVQLDGYDKNTGAFYPLLALGTFAGDTSVHATPVAAISKTQTGLPSYLAASWKNGSSQSFGIGVYDNRVMNSVYSWSALDLSTIFASQFSAARNPAIAIDALGPASKPVPNFYMVWEETGTSGGIRLLHGSYKSSVWPPAVSQITWEGAQIYHVADNNATDVHSNPSIAFDATGNVFIAWQYRGTAAGSIRVQSRDGYTSGAVLSNVSFAPCGTSSPSSPSLCDYRYTSSKANDLSLIWSASNGINCSQLVGGTWSGPYVVASGGSQANIEYTFSSSDVERVVSYTGTTGPPFSIGTTLLPPPQVPTKTTLSSPSNSNTGMILAPTLSWNCSMGSSTYNLHVNDDYGFVRDYTGISQTFFQVSGLNYSTAYHWRVQAVNPVGGGAWSDTWTFTTQASAPSGCPYVFGWDGSEFTADNNILPASEYPGNEGKAVEDYYRLRSAPREENGRYTLQLREFEEEESHLENMRLIAVDHADSTEIAVQPDGRIIQYTTQSLIQPDSSQPCRDGNALSAMDGTTIRMSQGDSITLTFVASADRASDDLGRGEGGVILGGRAVHNGAGLKGKTVKPQSLGHVSGGTPLPTPSSTFTFRERPSMVYIPLETLEDRVTIHFTNATELDYAALARVDSSAMIVKELKPQSATSMCNGHAASIPTAGDCITTPLHQGETIELQFEAPPARSKMHRCFILETRGRYDHISEEVGNGGPRSFGLAQNYPNPFNSETRLTYSLAASSHALLSIYNVLGEEVSRLVDEDQGAGEYEKVWEPNELPSGVYLARMIVRDRSGKTVHDQSRKLLLMK